MIPLSVLDQSAAVSGRPEDSSIRETLELARHCEALGYRRQKVRLHVYGHVLASRAEVVEWVKGSLLTD